MNKTKLYFTRIYFRYELSQGKLIEVDERHSGVGKTTILVEYATKHNLAIIVGNQRASDLILSINPSIKVIRLAENFTFEIKGQDKNCPNGVLIDNSVNPKMIRLVTVNNLKIIGGFEQDYKES